MVSFKVVDQDSPDLVLECVECGEVYHFPEHLSKECVSFEQFYADSVALAVNDHKECVMRRT